MQVVAWPLSPLLQSQLKPAVAVTVRSRCDQRPGAATARPRAMQAAEKPFKEYWASAICPFIKDDFERLRRTPPTRIAEMAQKDQVGGGDGGEGEGAEGEEGSEEGEEGSNSLHGLQDPRGGEGQWGAHECLHELGVDRAH